MSAVLGVPMKAERAGDKQCDYAAASGEALPTARLTVEPGNADAAMTGSGMVVKDDSGMPDAYEGMGDEIAVIGPSVWVRRGDDLVTITLTGVEEPEAKTRRIYDQVDKDY